VWLLRASDAAIVDSGYRDTQHAVRIARRSSYSKDWASKRGQGAIYHLFQLVRVAERTVAVARGFRNRSDNFDLSRSVSAADKDTCRILGALRNDWDSRADADLCNEDYTIPSRSCDCAWIHLRSPTLENLTVKLDLLRMSDVHCD
jgi:hypothetical protein